MRYRSNRWIVGAVVVLLASNAVGSASAANAADEKPTKLTVLCTVEERWCAAQTAAFEAETGITTTFVRLSGGDALAAVTDTTSTPEFSVWWGGSADGYVAAKAAGRLQPYTSPNAANVPKSRKDAKGAWTGIYVGALGFCSNRAKLAELGVPVPKSWQQSLHCIWSVFCPHRASAYFGCTPNRTSWRSGGVRRALRHRASRST